MKATDSFKEIISEHLNGLAAKDPLFAETLKKPKKNMDDCITYILNTVKSSGKNGFADEDIFGMAVHYYDEDDIKPGSAVKNYGVATNRPTKIKPVAPTKVEKKKAVKQQSPSNQIALF